MIFWEIYKTRIDFGTMMDIPGTQISQQKIAHILRTFVASLLVDITGSSEYQATNVVQFEYYTC